MGRKEAIAFMYEHLTRMGFTPSKIAADAGKIIPLHYPYTAAQCGSDVELYKLTKGLSDYAKERAGA